MTRPYIIIEQFSEDGEPNVHSFETVKKAADYLFASHRDDAIGFVWEINVTSRGVAYHLDRTSDFIAAWKAREEEELTEQWSDLETGRENEHFCSRGTLEAYLIAHANGPAMRKQSKQQLIAAE